MQRRFNKWARQFVRTLHHSSPTDASESSCFDATQKGSGCDALLERIQMHKHLRSKMVFCAAKSPQCAEEDAVERLVVAKESAELSSE